MESCSKCDAAAAAGWEVHGWKHDRYSWDAGSEGNEPDQGTMRRAMLREHGRGPRLVRELKSWYPVEDMAYMVADGAPHWMDEGEARKVYEQLGWRGQK